MSGIGDRSGSRSRRSWDREIEIMELVDRNRRIAEVMAECARLRGGSGALTEAKYRFWARALEHLRPIPGQRPDTALADVVITKKGKSVLQLKLMAGDVEAAERLSKTTGLPLGECLEVYSRLNILNTPSYMGGDLIEKGGAMTPKQRQKQLKEFVDNYQMTGSDTSLDKAVFVYRYRQLGQQVVQRPDRPVSSALGLLTARVAR
jgi:hypothetical protein